jgi:2-methylisocitrate lyase-like PEP mutase family enzyme
MTTINLRQVITQTEIIPFIGVYDVFSASIVGKYFQGIFISGFSFAASFYGLPDIGFISWSDIINFAHRVKTILPHHYILVDIDDGYVDTETACHVVCLLERMGISGVIIEDQKRPRRCGHLDGKLLLEIEEYSAKLKSILNTRKDLFVVARTDATEIEEILTRAKAYADAGADAILADGITDLSIIKLLKQEIEKPIVFNNIAGGKSPLCTLTELKKAGVSLVNYSTPCLFTAQFALEKEMERLKQDDGILLDNQVSVKNCTHLLFENLANRH